MYHVPDCHVTYVGVVTGGREQALERNGLDLGATAEELLTSRAV